MKELGFPIKYCKQRNSYYYTKAGRMVKHLFKEETASLGEELSDNAMRRVSGGESISPVFPKSDYIRLWDGNFVK